MPARRRHLPSITPAQRRGYAFFIRTYCVLFVLPAIACYFIIDSLGLNIGDFLGTPVHASEGQALAGLAIFLIAYAAFYRFGRKMLDLPAATSSPVQRNNLIYAIFVGSFVVDIFFYFAYGLGRAGSAPSTSLSFLSTMMPKDIALMLVLHVNAHRPRRALLIMVGFAAFALSLGWTGQFFLLFVTSLYLFRDWLRHRKWLVAAILVAGIAAYPAIFSIKQGVRHGDAFEYELLSVMHLAARLTGFPALVYIQGEQASLLSGITDYFDRFYYVVEPLLAIIPKTILGLQGNITLEKAIVDYVSGDPVVTQFIWGLPTKFWFYWQVDPLHFAVFCVANALVFGGAYVWAWHRRDAFLTFYLLYLLGLYIWAGDIQNLFVSFLRIAIFFVFYAGLDALFPRRRLRRAATPVPMAVPVRALK